MALNPEFKERWLKALTDGSYIHYTGQLKTDAWASHEGHCCLGVVCELMDAMIDDDGQEALYKDSFETTMTGSNNYKGFIPDVLANELGLTVDDQQKLAELNDAEHGDKFPLSVIEYINNL